MSLSWSGGSTANLPSMSDRCARAASGHAAAAPPRSVMKSRRLLSNMELPAALGDRKGWAPNCPCGRPEPFGIVPERPRLHEVTISHLQGVDFSASAVRVCLAKQQTVGEGGRRIEGDQRRRCRASEDEMSVTPKLSARMTDRRRRADPHRGGHAPPLPIIVPRAQRKTPPLGEGCGGGSGPLKDDATAGAAEIMLPGGPVFRPARLCQEAAGTVIASTLPRHGEPRLTESGLRA